MCNIRVFRRVYLGFSVKWYKVVFCTYDRAYIFRFHVSAVGWQLWLSLNLIERFAHCFILIGHSFANDHSIVWFRGWQTVAHTCLMYRRGIWFWTHWTKLAWCRRIYTCTLLNFAIFMWFLGGRFRRQRATCFFSVLFCFWQGMLLEVFRFRPHIISTRHIQCSFNTAMFSFSPSCS